MMRNIREKKIIFLICCLFLLTLSAARAEKVNYYYETGSWVSITDNVGDDKGPGYYLYPSDKRLRRGVFDIKKFTVYEEGQVVVFEIQMRNYIMREWPDTRKSEDQGFVANLWDIYIDIDGIENSGYKYALPGRDLVFADKMGWEKMILVSPLSEYELYDILRNKTDELEFQNQVDDIIYPDYVNIQRDKVIIKISKLKLPRISERSGYQCLSMGYKKIVSPNRLLNRDVRAFANFDDFGGGHDAYGDPPVMDIIVPEGDDQYALLRNYRSEPFRENISYASIPFVYRGGSRKSPAMAALEVKPMADDASSTLKTAPPVIKSPALIKAPEVTPSEKKSDSSTGFVPLKTPPIEGGFKPLPKAPDGFIPVKKSK
jgi:hypothetical protein